MDHSLINLNILNISVKIKRKFIICKRTKKRKGTAQKLKVDVEWCEMVSQRLCLLSTVLEVTIVTCEYTLCSLKQVFCRQ